VTQPLKADQPIRYATLLEPEELGYDFLSTDKKHATEGADLEGTPQRVRPRESDDPLVSEPHAVEHVAEVVLKIDTHGCAKGCRHVSPNKRKTGEKKRTPLRIS